MNCVLCKDTGWVCEFHMDKPWEGEGACGCGGAGCNCVCNPNGEDRGMFDAVYAAVDETQVKSWIQ